MNRYVAQGEGFPADNEFLMFIQQIIKEVGELASLGGQNYILKGCEENAGNVSDGWIVIAGEILPFQGGALGTEVTIIETTEDVTLLEDANNDNIGDPLTAYFTRIARFGNDGVNTINWNQLNPVETLIELQKAKVPIGTITMWSGAIASIPQYWQLCDGTDGTPDLRAKFVVGYDPDTTDYDAIGKQGGLSAVQLTANQNGQHTHTGLTNLGGAHTPSIALKRGESDGGNSGNDLRPTSASGTDITVQGNAVAAHSHSFTTNASGLGEAHENRPPYFTLAYIIYRGV